MGSTPILAIIVIVICIIFSSSLTLPRVEIKLDVGNGIKLEGLKSVNLGTKLNELSEDAQDKLRATCQKMANKCKGQKDEYKERRKFVKSSLVDELKNRGVSNEEADQQAEKRMSKIQELKVKWHEKNNISDIEPADDGLWGGDIVLRLEQVEFLIKKLEKTHGNGSIKKRSAATFFEAAPLSVWEMPISYWISTEFDTTQQNLIVAGLANITAGAPCIRFKQASSSSNSNQIQYLWYETSDTGCAGTSPIGRNPDGVNTIWIRPGGCDNSAFQYIVIHETIHSLGGHHEQTRTDRDTYVEILWENIDPQGASNFNIYDGSTSYGVSYDYSSIMHYSDRYLGKAYGDLKNQSEPRTMKPLQPAPESLGSYDLTPNDIKQLNRMYCGEYDTCADLYRDCGTRAMKEDCESFDMVSYCPRSCGKCICEDKDSNCGTWASSGECKKNSSWMVSNCPQSCGACLCQDKDASCGTWAASGECESNPWWMVPNCPRSCGTCPCEDKDQSCGTRTSSGECQSNPWWMGTYCPRSCNWCPCIDRSRNCTDWAAQNSCDTAYVAVTCPRSCGTCPAGSCVDRYPNCGAWAAGGSCAVPDSKKWIEINCQLSCGQCKP